MGDIMQGFEQNSETTRTISDRYEGVGEDIHICSD